MGNIYILLSALFVITITVTYAEKNDVKCFYKRNKWGSCDSTTNTMVRVFELESGPSPPCKANFTYTTTCHPSDCHYRPVKKPHGNWGPCENGVMEREDRLVGKRPEGCPETRKITKKC